jgi:hypothetical protein
VTRIFDRRKQLDSLRAGECTEKSSLVTAKYKESSFFRVEKPLEQLATTSLLLALWDEKPVLIRRSKAK